MTYSLKENGYTSILNVLPVWHMYERTVEYYVIYNGGTLCYTNIRNFKKAYK